MMRRLLQPLWVLLALIFLIEAWLWDHLEPVVARIVAWIPLRAFKAWLSARVERLSPQLTLVVFVVPLILLFPLKLVEVWLLKHHYWISAAALIVASKFIGVGVLAFIFDVTRSKLLQMAGSSDFMNWFSTSAGGPARSSRRSRPRSKRWSQGCVPARRRAGCG